jgi:hypothetical protein
MQLEFDKIKSNWSTFESLCKKAFGPDIDPLINELGDRICMAPASQRLDQYGAYPGGLVEHALTVTSYMRKLVATYELDIDVKTVLKVGLFHELGKIGDLHEDLFLEQGSKWHQEKLGQMYKYNEDLPKVAIPHLSLFLLQHFGVVLEKDEWVSIHLSQGSHLDENRFYVRNEPMLAVILQQAKQYVMSSTRHNDE